MSYCCPFINYNGASFGGHYGEETIKEEEEEQAFNKTEEPSNLCMMNTEFKGLQDGLRNIQSSP